MLLTAATIAYSGVTGVSPPWLSVSRRYVPITQLAAPVRAVVPRRATCWPGSRSGRCSCPRPSRYAALAGAPPEAGLSAALAAGVRTPSSAPAASSTSARARRSPSPPQLRSRPVAATFPRQEYTVLLAALALLTGVALVAAGALRLGLRVASSSPGPSSSASSAGSASSSSSGSCRSSSGSRSRAGNVPETLWRTSARSTSSAGGRRSSACVAARALLVLRRLAPRVPWALLVAAVSVALSRAFDFAAHGVAVIADVPTGLPSPPSRPRPRRDRRPQRRRARARARRDRRVDRRGPLAGGAARLRDRPQPGARRARRLERRRRAAAGLPGRRQPLAQRRRPPARACARGCRASSSRCCSSRRCCS